MLRISTTTGSVYLIDISAHTWQRVVEGADKDLNAPLRTTEGVYLKITTPTLGEGLVMLCPVLGINPAPFADAIAGRIIHTSDVVKIEEVADVPSN